MPRTTIDIDPLKSLPRPRRIVKWVAVVIAAWLAVSLFSRAFVSVDANEVAVKIVRGRVEGTLSPGWHLITPIGGKVVKFSTRLQQTSMLRTANEGDRAGDDSIEVASAEGARMNVDVTINYRLDKTRTVELFRTIRSADDLRERVVRPGVRSVMRDVFGLYKAKDAITSSRVEIQRRVATALNEKFDQKGITIETIDIREIFLPENIQSQVNEAIAAEAAAQKSAIQRKQAETEAETARIVAEKAAQTARAQANGLADAKRISAQAEADANAKIAASLTPGLIQLRQIEAVYKNGNQVYFLPQGASPNVFLTPTNNVGAPAAAAAVAAPTTTAPPAG